MWDNYDFPESPEPEPEDIHQEDLEYTFTWFIENYSYCTQRKTEALVSPKFRIRGFRRTIWRIHLFPRGSRGDRKGYISIFLRRSNLDHVPDTIVLHFELSILAPDESAVISKVRQCEFSRGSLHGCDNFLHMDDLFSKEKETLLSHDTFRVRCKMWMMEGKIRKIGQGFARTRVMVEHMHFIHEIKGFSALKPSEKDTFNFRYSKEGGTLQSRLKVVDSPSCGGNIIMKIGTSGSKKILSKCDLFLVGASGILTKCGEEDNRSDVERKDIGRLPLSLTRNDILDRKEEYLPKDKLTVLWQCSFSTGLQYEETERIMHDIRTPFLNHVNHDLMTEKLSQCSGVKDDLKAFYSKQLRTDVELRTETKSYRAHKYVLCARSSVFKEMLTNNMDFQSVQVDDLDNDTIEKLLHFLYSDDLENLEWNSAIKLYNAAEKYDIKLLKFKCSTFLLETLDTSNAVELLLLAHTHNDSDLERNVRNFIQKHEKQVCNSDEWLKLRETKPDFCETMLLNGK